MLDKIHVRSNVAVYLQIENHVQFAIASGVLKPGDQLPSVRELSERLKINPNTVAKSYRDLEVMGYLYTRRGMGVFINQDIQKKCLDTCTRKAVEKLHQAVSEARAAGIAKSKLAGVLNASYALDTDPYEEIPNSIAKLPKGK